MAIETSSLDDTFYRHFFDPEANVRDRAQNDLDHWFTEAADAGLSRYEITRQMICGIINAQNRRDAESADEVHFATTNSQPSSAEPSRRGRLHTPERSSSSGVRFGGLVLMVVAVIAVAIYTMRLFAAA